MALLDWPPAEKAAFLEQQFQAQDTAYRGAYDACRFDIIELDGEPVGRLYVDRRDDDIRIVDIALLAQYRNRGIGGALLRQLLDEGAATGRSVSIHVEKHNPALALYQRLGFRYCPERALDDEVYDFMIWTPGDSQSDGRQSPPS